MRAVMCEEDNCRRLLELILQFPIERVEVSKEKSIIYHPEYKGIRMDVYAKDANNTRYNVEMQSIRENALEKRTRYYHSQLDMDLLLSGAHYSELSNTYVIFIKPILANNQFCVEEFYSFRVRKQSRKKRMLIIWRGYFMEIVKLIMNFKEYYKLECRLRGNRELSHSLASNAAMSGSDFINQILIEIEDMEYDESGDTPLEYRQDEEGRELLRNISIQLYPNEPDKLERLLHTKERCCEGRLVKVDIAR